jgi:MFS family permease
VLLVVAAGYGLSALGDQLALVALTLRLHGQGGSGWEVSALFVAGIAPVVVLGPLAGPLIDRVETVRLLVAVTALQGLAAAGLAFVTGLAATLALVALLGAGLAVASPALLSLVPVITGRDGATRGYARLETFRAAGNVAGPALAGFAIAAAGFRATLLANAATFLVTALLAGWVLISRGVRRRPGPDATGSRWAAQVAAGITALSRDGLLRVALPMLAAAIVFTAIMSVARVFFAADVLHAGEDGFGLLVAAHTAGMLVTSGFVAARVPLRRQPAVLAGSGLLMGAALTLVASVPLLPVALAGFLLTGVSNSLQVLAIRSLISSRVPDALHGRAFASSSAVLNGANIGGTGLGGPLVTVLGGTHALHLAGAGTFLVTLGALPGLRRAARRPCRPTA